MEILKAGGVYFAFVFGAGFILGTIRVLWLVPSLGTRIAELIETPFMLVVTIFSANWVIRHLAIPSITSKRIAVGLIALSLLIVTEFSFVLWLRGLTINDYFTGRDPVAGTVYYLMLGAFALMPLLVARR